MPFRTFKSDGTRAVWDTITHVKLTDDPAAEQHMSDVGRRIVKQIRKWANSEGIASIADIEPDFPSRQHTRRGTLGDMRYDLKQMANELHTGKLQQDKGLLELGSPD